MWGYAMCTLLLSLRLYGAGGMLQCCPRVMPHGRHLGGAGVAEFILERGRMAGMVLYGRTGRAAADP